MGCGATREVKQRINEKVKVAGNAIRWRNNRENRTGYENNRQGEQGDTNKNSTPECAVNNKRYVT